MKKIIMLAMLLVLVLNACDSGSNKSDTEEQAQEQKPMTRLDSLKQRMGGQLATGTDADKAATAFGEKIAKESAAALRANLEGALEKGGVEQALTYCFTGDENLHNPIEEKYGVKISRVSHKPRNPNSEASRQEKELIGIIQSKLQTGEDVPALKEDTNSYTYYHPIITQQMCLKCHGMKGKDIDEVDVMTIELMYPVDRATGFKVGDVRGLWKISFSKDRLRQETNTSGI